MFLFEAQRMQQKRKQASAAGEAQVIKKG